MHRQAVHRRRFDVLGAMGRYRRRQRCSAGRRRLGRRCCRLQLRRDVLIARTKNGSVDASGANGRVSVSVSVYANERVIPSGNVNVSESGRESEVVTMVVRVRLRRMMKEWKRRRQAGAVGGGLGAAGPERVKTLQHQWRPRMAPGSSSLDGSRWWRALR